MTEENIIKKRKIIPEVASPAYIRKWQDAGGEIHVSCSDMLVSYLLSNAFGDDDVGFYVDENGCFFNSSIVSYERGYIRINRPRSLGHHHDALHRVAK